MGIVHSGARNPNWQGGRHVASNGYVIVRVGVDHHLADVRGYAYEHRLAAESILGRRLRPGEVVHHLDGNKANNSHDNLEVVTRPQHQARHRRRSIGLRLPDEPNPVVQCACGCGVQFYKYDTTNRPRKYVSGHNEKNNHGTYTH